MNIILVVDENPKNLVLITSQLLILNYEVVTATIAGKALDIARLLKPSLIIMDSYVNDDADWTEIRQLRQIDELRDVPLIVISGNGIPQVRARAIEAGCTEFIRKPYDIRLLGEIVNRYFTRDISATNLRQP